MPLARFIVIEIVFSPITAKQWNALPSNIISSNSIESFQKNFKKISDGPFADKPHAHWRDVPLFASYATETETETLLEYSCSVGCVPYIPTAAVANGAATRSPFCLQPIPPDIQRYQHDGWA